MTFPTNPSSLYAGTTTAIRFPLYMRSVAVAHERSALASRTGQETPLTPSEVKSALDRDSVSIRFCYPLIIESDSPTERGSTYLLGALLGGTVPRREENTSRGKTRREGKVTSTATPRHSLESGSNGRRSESTFSYALSELKIGCPRVSAVAAWKASNAVMPSSK